MKKRFALYGMFAAMAIFATACGDDSSSGPEEESSSSIEAEDESSSSVEEEGKSSAADKKSSSSKAKKGDSSSSEKNTSSSSEAVSSSSEISYEPTCVVKTEGSVASVETHFYATDMGGDVEQIVVVDYDNYTVSSTLDFAVLGVTSCEEAKLMLGEQVKSCSAENKTVSVVSTIPSEYFEPTYGTLANAKEAICGVFLSEFIVDTTALNQEMLAAGKYGTFRDTRDAMLYRTIKIGNQTWMAQNLLYETESGSSCYDDPMPEGTINGNCLVYGRLYTWDVAKEVCPDGWRLPTTTEWDDLLTKTMGAEAELYDFTTYTGEGISLLGVEGSANEYGLSFVLGGAYGSPEEAVPSYRSKGENGVYWLADEEGNASAVAIFSNEHANMFADLGEANMQLYVRCVKGNAPAQPGTSK